MFVDGRDQRRNVVIVIAFRLCYVGLKYISYDQQDTIYEITVRFLVFSRIQIKVSYNIYAEDKIIEHLFYMVVHLHPLPFIAIFS